MMFMIYRMRRGTLIIQRTSGKRREVQLGYYIREGLWLEEVECFGGEYICLTQFNSLFPTRSKGAKQKKT